MVTVLSSNPFSSTWFADWQAPAVSRSKSCARLELDLFPRLGYRLQKKLHSVPLKKNKIKKGTERWLRICDRMGLERPKWSNFSFRAPDSDTGATPEAQLVRS